MLPGATVGDEISLSGATVSGEPCDVVLDRRAVAPGFAKIEVRKAVAAIAAGPPFHPDVWITAKLKIYRCRHKACI